MVGATLVVQDAMTNQMLRYLFFGLFLPFSFALSSLTLNSSPKLLVYPSIYKEKCGTNSDGCAILYYYYYVCFVYLFSFWFLFSLSFLLADIMTEKQFEKKKNLE